MLKSRRGGGEGGGDGERQVVPFKADNYFSIVYAINDKNAALATITAVEKWLRC